MSLAAAAFVGGVGLCVRVFGERRDPLLDPPLAIQSPPDGRE